MPRYSKKEDFDTGLALISPFFDSIGFAVLRLDPYREDGGTCYSARFDLPPRSVSFVHIYSLCAITYSIREFSIEHTAYTQALGVSSMAHYPSYDDDSISGYPAWLHDLQTLVSPFFTGPEQDFIAIASQYIERRHRQDVDATRDQAYRGAQEPRLKAQARELFFQGRYQEVVRLESQIQFPEFLTNSERQFFSLARKRL